MLTSYLKYYLKSTTVNKVASPFVSELLETTLEDDRTYYQFGEIEAVRKRLLRNHRVIEVTDYGAGSRTSATKKRKVSDIAKTALSPKFYAQFLFRLVNHLQPKTILELGTSFGISALHLYLPNRKAKMVTLEGCPQIATIAQNNFKQMDATGIELLNAPFDEALPTALEKLGKIDLLFIDGNHKREPTLFYFKTALDYAHGKSCFVFHDIHWTQGMESAWYDIQNHPKVKITIDLFFMGLVFFESDDDQKQHYTVTRKITKPWA